MTEPGSILRVRVVHVQGKSIAGAVVATNTWHGHRSIEFRAETDQDGRVAWQRPPGRRALQHRQGRLHVGSIPPR